MDINVYTDRYFTKNISVEGAVEAGELQQLFHLLDICCAEKLHITFIDAGFIPAALVEKLHHLYKSGRVRISIMKSSLYFYLLKLGLHCELITQKQLGSKSKAAGSELPEDDRVLEFLKALHDKYGYDYSNYQLTSIKRRINVFMLRFNITGLEELSEQVLSDSELFEQLFTDFSINVTEFFRDPEVFAFLKNSVLPYLNTYPFLKIWCAGCSNGKEAYSLAIMLYEWGLYDRVMIYATDINPFVVTEGKNGLYPIDTVDKAIINYRKASGEKNFMDYFELKGSYIKVREELSRNLLFFQHSLVGSGIINEFQLILCRNVLIYFNPELQKEVLANFYKSLDMSGFFVLGKSEGLLQNDGYMYFSNFSEDHKVYRKINQPV